MVLAPTIHLPAKSIVLIAVSPRLVSRIDMLKALILAFKILSATERRLRQLSVSTLIGK
jgi:hypothetical protein